MIIAYVCMYDDGNLFFSQDDDEECFHSDDEDDHKGVIGTPSHSKPTVTGPTPQPIGVYASLDEIMDDDTVNRNMCSVGSHVLYMYM